MTAKQTAFLAAYEVTGVVTEAATAAGVSRRSHSLWMKDPEYAQAFADAEEIAIEAMETEARQRAVEGSREPVIYQGRVCFDVARDASTGDVLLNDEGFPIMSQQPLTVPRKSDNLLMFLLKSKRPDKYRDNVKIEHTGEIQVLIDRLQAGRKRLQSQPGA